MSLLFCSSFFNLLFSCLSISVILSCSALLSSASIVYLAWISSFDVMLSCLTFSISFLAAVLNINTSSFSFSISSRCKFRALKKFSSNFFLSSSLSISIVFILSSNICSDSLLLPFCSSSMCWCVASFVSLSTKCIFLSV